ncbi:S41 family peptidase [Tamlana sp. 2_MG-2023]|uniref:S41 family peptidase n=1 Tax=unclassified Tamlana TaxID=2614803 RepID=UPI0026E3ED14|nr:MULTISPECIES: S41 family peptidase [unclassified Tamlana]MDO6760043.1 S41 family peptidase [Tamlana sp. 2_MG-2023]MDO6790259.1 S41 family peptidase [Tamlana sp. 1_MG-2023]
MKKLKIFTSLTLLFCLFNLTLSCSKSDDDITPDEKETDEPIVLNNEVNDFVWLGLNEIYLWQDEVPNLADDKFSNTDDYFKFLNTYDTPESLFDDLLYQRGDVDKFSFIVDDYRTLNNAFQGISKSNGLDIGLVRISNTNDIFGYVSYVANNSDAATKDIKRGDFFMFVDNEQLTVDNYGELLFGTNDSYTLGMATITNTTIEPNGKNVTLTKTEFTETPIHISKVIEAQGIKVGYLMYNSFIANFDNELNTTIADLKAQGITELVLDLRYNPGGRVSSALALCSMITGQFHDDVLIKEQWNSKYQNYFEQEDPEFLINRFPNVLLDGTSISSLNLSKVYILTTNGTASASELIINGLDPYIDVVQIGTNTTGKYTASVTLYDSEDFGQTNANPNHTYALQPLVYKSTNANGVSDYSNGLVPDYLMTYQTSNGSTTEGENLVNMGALGDENEPFLATALSLISGTTTKANQTNKAIIGLEVEHIAESNDFKPLKKGMFTTFKQPN